MFALGPRYYYKARRARACQLFTLFGRLSKQTMATGGEERAAAVLQSGCRGIAGRKELVRRKSAANVIQQRIRRKTDGQKQSKAAIVLESSRRRRQAPKRRSSDDI